MDKEAKRPGMFITMKELKMHDIRGFKAITRMGPEQFDQILQEIEPCTYLQKVHKDGWGWFNKLFGWIFNNFV